MRGHHERTDRLAGCVLYLMFFLLLGVGALLLCFAFADLLASDRAARSILSEIRTRSGEQAVANAEQIEPWAEALADRLASLTNGALGYHTMAFLFQVFSVALVGAGVYLLNRSFKNLRRAEGRLADHVERSRRIAFFVECRVICQAMHARLHAAHQLAALWRAVGPDDRYYFVITGAREALNQASGQLDLAKQEMIGMSADEHCVTLDLLASISDTLSKSPMPTEQQENTDPTTGLGQMCEAMTQVMSDTPFCDWYRRQAADALPGSSRHAY